MKPLLLTLLFTITAFSSDLAIKCLSMTIYHEARGSSLADQAAVADVVLNRVESSRYPNTVCGVVKQKHQFSFYWDGLSDRMRDIDSAKSAYLLAHQVLNEGRFRGVSEGSLFYHATYILPYWAKSFDLVGTIGSHKYYRTNKGH